MVSALYSSDDALIKATTPKAKRRTSKYSILMILFLLIPKNLHEVDSEVRQHIFLNILKYSDYKSKILSSTDYLHKQKYTKLYKIFYIFQNL